VLSTFLVATPRGRTFVDRELYLPKAWTEVPLLVLAAHVRPGQRGVASCRRGAGR